MLLTKGMMLIITVGLSLCTLVCARIVYDDLDDLELQRRREMEYLLGRPTRRKGTAGGEPKAHPKRQESEKISTSAFNPVDAPGATLLWYAPVLSSSGYGSEAMEILQGLDSLLTKNSDPSTAEDEDTAKKSSLVAINTVNHGDQASHQAMYAALR